MTMSTSSSITPNSTKQSSVIGCFLAILTFVFLILGIYDLIFGFLFAFVFSSARMFSLATIAIVAIIACDCFIYFFLVLRIKRQHWLISVVMLAAIWLVLPLPLRFLLNTATARVRIDGFAMGATLPNGSYVLADRQAYQHNDPQRGDIVIFQIPTSPNSDLLKRIIGLPGEVVTINQGEVLINGTPINEPYISEKPAYKGEWKVPEGQYFVLGDNRNDSKDSHQWGTLPREYILAKVVWIYFPISSFGKIVDINYVP